MQTNQLAFFFLMLTWCCFCMHNEKKTEIIEYPVSSWYHEFFPISTADVVYYFMPLQFGNRYHPLRNTIGSQLLLALVPRCGAPSSLSCLPREILRNITELATLLYLDKTEQANAFTNAIVYKDAPQIERFIGYGIDVNWRNSDHKLPINIAAAQDSLPIVTMLLAAGARVDVFDGHNPIELATNDECQKRLLAALKKENAEHALFLEFFKAYAEDDDKTLEKVIAQGFSPDEVMIPGTYTPILFHAVTFKKISLFKVLLSTCQILRERNPIFKATLLEFAKQRSSGYVNLIQEELEKRQR